MSLTPDNQYLSNATNLYLAWKAYAEGKGGERRALDNLSSEEKKTLAVAIQILHEKGINHPATTKAFDAYTANNRFDRLLEKLGGTRTEKKQLPPTAAMVAKSFKDIYPLLATERVLEQRFYYNPFADQRLSTISEGLKNSTITTYEELQERWGQWTATLVGEVRKDFLEWFKQNPDLAKVLQKKGELFDKDVNFLIGKIADIKITLDQKNAEHLARLPQHDREAIQKTGITLHRREIAEARSWLDKAIAVVTYPFNVVKRLILTPFGRVIDTYPEDKRDLAAAELLARRDYRNLRALGFFLTDVSTGILAGKNKFNPTNHIRLTLLTALARTSNVLETSVLYPQAFTKILLTLQEKGADFEKLLIGLVTENVHPQPLGFPTQDNEKDIIRVFQLSGLEDLPREVKEGVVQGLREIYQDRNGIPVKNAISGYRVLSEQAQDYLRHACEVLEPHIQHPYEAGCFAAMLSQQVEMQEQMVNIEALEFATSDEMQERFQDFIRKNPHKTIQEAIKEFVVGIRRQSQGTLSPSLTDAISQLTNLIQRTSIWAKYASTIGSNVGARVLAQLYIKFGNWGPSRYVNPQNGAASSKEDGVEVGLTVSFNNCMADLERAEKAGAKDIQQAKVDLLIKRYAAAKENYWDFGKQMTSAERTAAAQAIAKYREEAVEACNKYNKGGLYQLATHGSVEAGEEYVKIMRDWYFGFSAKVLQATPSRSQIHALTVLSFMGVDGAKFLLRDLKEKFSKNKGLQDAYQLVEEEKSSKKLEGLFSNVLSLAVRGLGAIANDPSTQQRLDRVPDKIQELIKLIGKLENNEVITKEMADKHRDYMNRALGKFERRLESPKQAGRSQARASGANSSDASFPLVEEGESDNATIVAPDDVGLMNSLGTTNSDGFDGVGSATANDSVEETPSSTVPPVQLDAVDVSPLATVSLGEGAPLAASAEPELRT